MPETLEPRGRPRRTEDGSSIRQALLELIEGNQLVTIDVGDFFTGRVETPDQLEAAIASLRHRIEELLGKGKKMLIQ